MIKFKEYTEAGVAKSMHDGSHVDGEMQRGVIIVVPRAFTDVCSKEVVDFNDRQAEFMQSDIPLYLASADSPEVNSIWLGEFDNPVSLLTMTLKQSQNEDDRLSDVFSEGYTNRCTIYVNDGKIEVVPQKHDEQRSFDDVLAYAKDLFKAA